MTEFENLRDRAILSGATGRYDMKPSMILTAVALTIASALAASAHCAAHSQQTMSCAAGTVWDEQSTTCVPETTG